MPNKKMKGEVLMKYLVGLLMLVLFGLHMIPEMGMAAGLPYLYGMALVLSYQLLRSNAKKLLAFG